MQLTSLKGISDGRKKDLNKLGIFNLYDLVRHFPRNYLDLTHQVKISECKNNEFAFVLAKVLTSPQVSGFSKGKNYIKVLAITAGEPFSVIWFNQPYIKSYIKEGEEYFFYARVQNRYGAATLVNPIFERVDQNYRLKGLLPIYKITGSLSQKIINGLILAQLKKEPQVSAIPEFLQKKYALESLNYAYNLVHNPSSESEYLSGSKRIAVEEFFLLIAAFKFLKGDANSARVHKYTATQAMLSSFIKKMPFDLTNGQNLAISDIYNDLASSTRMNRLIQGDVGSGKTAVALCAIFLAVSSGYQAAMLAPTEVLARQNYNILVNYFGAQNVVYLAGSQTAAQKKQVKAQINSGSAKIVCGTHAILQSDVVFNNLSLCVCDEQHRFGVGQRSDLAQKGAVDMLVMSATPIPRTLSLIIYGDLEISEIKDKPLNRGTVKTVIVLQHKYDDMLRYIKDQIKSGKQAYMVCPRIEDDEEGTYISVTELFNQVEKEFSGINCAILHGKMKEKEKLETMDKFRQGEIACLVSTTVIEVGVDVKNATIMAIYGAERFGLSQLHQLRGRIGRGEDDSYCFLLLQSQDAASVAERLKLFKSSNDGFEIAAFDYQLRGGGDFLGTRQSGKFFNEIKNLRYGQDEIMFAKKLVEEVFALNQSFEGIRQAAMKKYNKLKDIILN